MIQVAVTDKSHVDHAMTEEQRAYVLDKVRCGGGAMQVNAGLDAFFIVTVDLPEHMGAVPCALRGPIMGDKPVLDSQCTHEKRGDRPNVSRMCSLPPTTSWLVTVIVIGGNLATMYGGPLAPKEPTDPYLEEEEALESAQFWAQHALAKV